MPPPVQAIEAFALMVKTTAQTLQSFGTELAETELPNDVEATTNLLHTHTLKKDKMKVFFSVFSIHGNQKCSHIQLIYNRFFILFVFAGGSAGGAVSRGTPVELYQRASSNGSRLQHDV